MQTTAPSSAPAPEAAADENRARLLDALSTAVAEKGYAATTIADVVRHARVSKRTFYEHFEDKEACFLAAYQAWGRDLLRAIAAAEGAESAWEKQIDAAARAYFRLLEENPRRAHAFLVEVHAAGPRALKQRREIHQQFADLLRGLVQAGRRQSPGGRALSPAMATALVGAINELVLVALEKERPGSVRELWGTAAELVRAVLAAPRA